MQSAPEQLINERQHYKELGQKLKVSYIEEETRERYLRMLAEDISPDSAARAQLGRDNPKHLHEPTLESRNVESKATLQAQKAAVQACQAQITTLSQRIPTLKRRVEGTEASVRTLEAESATLRASVQELQQLQQNRPQPLLSVQSLQQQQDKLADALSGAHAEAAARNARVEQLRLHQRALQTRMAHAVEAQSSLLEQAAGGPASGAQHELGQMLVALTHIARQIEA